MEVKLNKISPNQVELEIEIPSSLMDGYFELAASELSKNMKVNGFRPGKVPLEIVERQIGSKTLYDEAANIAVSRTLPKAIIENNIEIIGRPEIVITQIARGNPMKYKAKILIFPEMKLAEYRGLEIKKQDIKVDAKEIDESLKYLQKSRTKLVTVNRPAQKGDRIELDFIIRNNGVKIEGSESKNQPMILGEGKFIPGFEKELEGMKAGEEKDFIIKAPADWHQKNLANKNLDFSVKINLVQERQIPEISDEFAKSLGNFDSLLSLKKNISEGILEEKKLKDKERIRVELIEKVADKSRVDIPEALIDNELDKMINELRGNIEEMGLEFDRYLQEIKKTPEELKKEWRKIAEKRVKVALALREIARKEKTEASEEEISEKVNEMLKFYSSIEEAKKNLDSETLKEYAKNVLINEKVFQLLEREAKSDLAKQK